MLICWTTASRLMSSMHLQLYHCANTTRAEYSHFSYRYANGLISMCCEHSRSDLFLFRLQVPSFCSFDLRLFTRERQPHAASGPTTAEDASSLPAAAAVGNRTKADDKGARGRVGEHRVSKPTCSRILRVESIDHTILASPTWNTLLIAWNNLMQNWIKSTGQSSAMLTRQR